MAHFVVVSTRKKFALIIGNDNYERSKNKLDNSIKAAKELGRILKEINFTVIVLTDIRNENQIMRKVQEFHDTITNDALVLFYFSGHGYQFDGHNYLIPTDDSRIEEAEDLKDLGSNVTRIVERLLQNKTSCMVIMVLDCCRPYVLGKSTAPICKLSLS